MYQARSKYDVFEHMAEARLTLDFRPIQSPSLYYWEKRLILVREGMSGAETKLAIAHALARRDLNRTDHNDASDTEAAHLAVTRLVPLDRLARALIRNSGGITAVATDLGVPTTAIRTRIEALKPCQRAYFARVHKAKSRIPRAAARCSLAYRTRAAAGR